MRLETLPASGRRCASATRRSTSTAAAMNTSRGRICTVPGALDLCFIADRPLDQVIERLRREGVAIVEGPVLRTGATHKLRSGLPARPRFEPDRDFRTGATDDPRRPTTMIERFRVAFGAALLAALPLLASASAALIHRATSRWWCRSPLAGLPTWWRARSALRWPRRSGQSVVVENKTGAGGTARGRLRGQGGARRLHLPDPPQRHGHRAGAVPQAGRTTR